MRPRDLFLDLAINPESNWMDRAACATADPLTFVGGDGSAGDDAALALCRRCPVREECGRYADETGQQFGIWGGARRG